jgi:hypothetical protein
VRQAIREGWPVHPKRGLAIIRQLLSADAPANLLIAIANTVLLAAKSNMAHEVKVGKILERLGQDAITTDGEARKAAISACRAISRRSKPEWLVRRSRIVLRLLKMSMPAGQCQVSDQVEHANQTPERAGSSR